MASDRDTPICQIALGGGQSGEPWDPPDCGNHAYVSPVKANTDA